MSDDKKTYCECLYYSANALSRIMTKMAEEEFSSTGLPPSYGFLLMTVNQRPGIQMKEICQIMQLTPSTVTRFVEKMEGKGLLARQTQGRMTEVYPTPKSKELQASIQQAWNSLAQRYKALLGEEFAKQLTGDVTKAITKLCV